MEFIDDNSAAPQTVTIPQSVAPSHPIDVWRDRYGALHSTPPDIVADSILNSPTYPYSECPVLRVIWNEQKQSIELWTGIQNGRPLKRDEWERLRFAVNSFYQQTSDEEIEHIYESLRIAMTTIKEEMDRVLKKGVETRQKGYIYFLRANSYVKIGRTNNIDRRMAQIQPRLPFKTQVFHVVETNDPVKYEHFFHDKFKDKRANGEWFELSDDDLEWILTL